MGIIRESGLHAIDTQRRGRGEIGRSPEAETQQKLGMTQNLPGSLEGPRRQRCPRLQTPDARERLIDHRKTHRARRLMPLVRMRHGVGLSRDNRINTTPAASSLFQPPPAPSPAAVKVFPSLRGPSIKGKSVFCLLLTSLSFLSFPSPLTPADSPLSPVYLRHRLPRGVIACAVDDCCRRMNSPRGLYCRKPCDSQPGYLFPTLE